MPRIYWIFRDIFIYRDGDRFVPIYAEALCGNPSRAVEAGGIKHWHPSDEPITPGEKEEILETLRSHARNEETTYNFSFRDQSQPSWDRRWDKVIDRQDTIEALPYQFKLGAEWISTYQKGTLTVKIPIIKPVYQEDFKIVRFSPSTQWLTAPEGERANFDKVKKDIQKWSRVSGFAIEFAD
jgi:hypothetical protein